MMLLALACHAQLPQPSILQNAVCTNGKCTGLDVFTTSLDGAPGQSCQLTGIATSSNVKDTMTLRCGHPSPPPPSSPQQTKHSQRVYFGPEFPSSLKLPVLR